MSIAVVIPIYNVEKYLEDCVNSVLEQTKKADEIILIDDGSTDKSSNICDEYAKKYSQIKVIHKNNNGLGEARNTGIDYCTQEFITFIDSDDFLDKDYLSILMESINKGFDTCKSSYKKVDIHGKLIKKESIFSNIYKGSSIKKELIPRLIGSAPGQQDSIPMSSCATIYSMEIIKKNKLRFVSEREWISEDTLFNIEYYMRANKVNVINYVGYNYRTNPNSLTTKYMNDRFERCKEMYLKEKEILIQNQLWNLSKERLARQLFNNLRLCFVQLTKKVSGFNAHKSIFKISKICSDDLVSEVVSKYPINDLTFKQRFFLILVKKKRARIIYTLYNYFNIK